MIYGSVLSHHIQKIAYPKYVESYSEPVLVWKAAAGIFDKVYLFLFLLLKLSIIFNELKIYIPCYRSGFLKISGITSIKFT